MKRHVYALWALIILSCTALAQPDGLSIQIMGGVSAPVGDFGRTLGEYASITRRAGFNIGDAVGLAGLGFGGGVELVSPAWLNNMSWVLGARIFVNGTNESTAQQKFQSWLGGTSQLSYEVGEWINIPVMTGLRYEVALTEVSRIYGIVQGGINMTRAAQRQATVGGVVVEEAKYEFTRDFGFEAGFGLLYQQRYNLSVRYLDLGSPRYEGTRVLSEKQFPAILSRENAVLGEQRSVSMLVVTLGVEFSL